MEKDHTDMETQKQGHGSNVPPVNIPIPTKIGSKIGGDFTYQPTWDQPQPQKSLELPMERTPNGEKPNGNGKKNKAMGQKPVPPLNIPILTKIGSKLGGEFTYQPKWDPKTVVTTTATQILGTAHGKDPKCEKTHLFELPMEITRIPKTKWKKTTNKLFEETKVLGPRRPAKALEGARGPRCEAISKYCWDLGLHS